MKLRMMVKGHKHREGFKPEEASTLILLEAAQFGEIRFKGDPAAFPLGSLVSVVVVEPDL